MLSSIEQIFDLLGLIVSVIIEAKLLIQQLWNLKLGWDDKILNHLWEFRLKFISQVHLMNKIKTERH